MKLKKLICTITVGLVTLIPFSNYTYASENYNNNNKTEEGKNYFKAFYFAQGNLGKKMKSDFTNEYYKELNDKDSLKFTNKLLSQMNNVDDSYFKKLSQSVDSKDPIQADKLLLKGKTIVKKKQSYQKRV